MTTTQTIDHAAETEEAPTTPSDNPGPLSTLFFGLALLCVFGLLAVGIKNTFFPDNSRLERAEQQLSIAHEQITSLQSWKTYQEPKLAKQEETIKGLNYAVTQQHTHAMSQLSTEECARVDHFGHLGLMYQDQVGPDGSVFHFDCTTKYWGWYFSGDASHTWTARTVSRDAFATPGITKIQLPLSAINPPASKQHPKYPNAVRLDQVHPNQVLCVRNPPRDGEPAGMTRQITLQDTRSIAYLNADGTVWAYPAFSYVLQGSDGKMEEWSMQEFGLIPYENGRWSTIHLTAGAC